MAAAATVTQTFVDALVRRDFQALESILEPKIVPRAGARRDCHDHDGTRGRSVFSPLVWRYVGCGATPPQRRSAC